MAVLLEVLRRRGVPGVYCAPVAENVESHRFYERMGFAPVPVAGHEAVPFLARRISPVGDSGPFPKAQDLASFGLNASG